MLSAAYYTFSVRFNDFVNLMKAGAFLTSLLLTGMLVAQKAAAQQESSPGMLLREVSGIVKDSTDQIISGASITLTFEKDTLRTITNSDGVFVFKNVRESTFAITVKSIGYVNSFHKFFYNISQKQIILDPIILRTQLYTLKEVKIDGRPSIVYKADTVEYKASDYKVRPNATVAELLKKMEGMEVGVDGSLKYHGREVTKAKLNGKDFSGGDVAQAIKNLPADIVEKAQIVNDYGDQAARTGIKDGTSIFALNLTTKIGKSVGDIIRLNASGGSYNRYDEQLLAERINLNEQLGFIGKISNTINGIAGGVNLSSGAGANGSGGTTTSGGPSFNYRDQWGKNIQINTSYSYQVNDVNLINNNVGQSFNSLGTTSFIRNSTATNNSKRHSAGFEFEFTPDSSNFLKITPTFVYNDLTSSDNGSYTQTGFQNQYSNGLSSGKSPASTFGTLIFYQYIFKKNHRRNLSLQFNLTHGNQQQNNEQNTEIQYKDSFQHLLKDSTIHRMIDRRNLSWSYRSSLTYTEPLTNVSQLDFNAQINYRSYQDNATAGDINSSGLTSIIDSLSNSYAYSFTETRLTLAYKLKNRKYSLAIGISAIPTELSGPAFTRAKLIDRDNLHIVPVFNLGYQFSRTQQLNIHYTGIPVEPTFDQLQPFPDFTDPQNPVYGNPALKPAFMHNIVIGYNNYITNSKLNISGDISGGFYQDQVANNILQISQPAVQSFLTETHFVNISGSRSVVGTYNVAKQLNDMKYSLSLNGRIAYNYDLGVSNNIPNHLTVWDLNERFGPRINPSESIEINPYIAYDVYRTFNSIPFTNNNFSGSNNIRTTTLNLEGKFYLFNDQNFTIEYNLSKNFIKGIDANITKNPFVANLYAEESFFRKKNGVLRVSVFDIFNQNNFISHIATPAGFTDTKTNALSRYVSISFIWYLQKWTGVAKRNGKTIKRRGDGSFIIK
jgi:hypothetical protein